MQIRVHRQVLDKIPEKDMDDLILNEVRLIDQAVHFPDNTIKLNRLSVYLDPEDRPVTIKCVYARGINLHALTITVPKPHYENHGLCSTCEGIGWDDPNKVHLCGDCYGLGYHEIHHALPNF